MNWKVPVSVALLLTAASVRAEPPEIDTTRGDRLAAKYFEKQTRQLQRRALSDIASQDQWQARRKEYKAQLLEMLGLDPMPSRTPLNAVVTGQVEEEDFVVENLHFQSRPGLYVTGNLYRPKEVEGELPAVLYVCGHGRVKKDGVSYGNKVHYQHHGAWFARNGYVCLTIDTVQLGEIEGIHHGTYRYDMWWWLNRGYTPAGVEAWNCVRALDYLQSRPEVDSQRLGVTGRSGGGVYSWWIASIDDRIKAAVPVAGITDLENHVVDGCVEGHCDCMYMVNTYRWDYPTVAAMVAPRPLLISNTDSDRIFPLDGVVRTFNKTRSIYRLYDEADKVALNITAGPHKDTQELRVHAFRWLNQHLKDDDSLIDKPAVKYFEPEQLKVFDELPEDQKNSEIHETFVEAADAPEVPEDQEAWQHQRQQWRETLKDKSFRAWPQDEDELDREEAFAVECQGLQLRGIDFTSQNPFRLRLYVLQRAGLKHPERTVLNVLDEQSWSDFLAAIRPGFEEQLSEETLPEADQGAFERHKKAFESSDAAVAYLAPRGIGPTAWDQSERKQTQHRRRFYLLGQSLDGMRVYDVRRAIQALRSWDDLADVPLWLQSQHRMAGVALYASLFEPEIARLDLYELPQSHRQGPFLLNVRRYLDMPQTVAMAGEASEVVIYQEGDEGWDFTRQLAEQLEWDDQQFRIEGLSADRPPLPCSDKSGEAAAKAARES